jgi:pimeloyl-ACP methyl ester carboxylesterase
MFGPEQANAYILPQIFESGVANDLPHSEAAVLAATQTTFATEPPPSSPPPRAWKTKPSRAVVSRQDKVIPPHSLELMYARAHAHVTEINGSHLSLISHPSQITRVILAAATSF